MSSTRSNSKKIEIIPIANDSLESFEALAMCCAEMHGAAQFYSQLDRDFTLPGEEFVAEVKNVLDSQFHLSLDDQRTYVETFAHATVAALDHTPRQIAIAGGGDGIIAREFLRYREVESLTIVEARRPVTEVYAQWSLGRQLNDDVYKDPRVQVVNDRFEEWLPGQQEYFDIIAFCLIAPPLLEDDRLIETLSSRLNEGGIIAVQSIYPPEEGHTQVDLALKQLRAAGFEGDILEVPLPSLNRQGVGSFALAARENIRERFNIPKWLPNLSINLKELESRFRGPRGKREKPRGKREKL